MKFSYEKYAAIRDSAGMTDYKVAKATGIPKQTVYEWRKGSVNPTIEKLSALSGLFSVPIESFIEKE